MDSTSPPGTAVTNEGRASGRWDGLFRYRFLAGYLVLLIGFLIVVLRCAWVTEDAYIMFRTIDNALHGEGLTWNPGERVQVYTCPFWMFTLLGAVAVTGEYFFTSIAVSVILALATLLILIRRLVPTFWAGALAIVALTSCKGFVEYSTSGLENCLSHLMYVGFLALFFKSVEKPEPRGLGLLTFLATLGTFNRLDTVLLYGPALLLMLYLVKPKKEVILYCILGGLVIIAWEAFCLVYYGFIFPNTAYAKLYSGYSSIEKVLNAWGMYTNGVLGDPVGMLIMLLGGVSVFLGRKRPEIAVFLGIVLYHLYILKVGGDYMGMRFFTVTILGCIVLVCRLPVMQQPKWAVSLSVILVGLSIVQPRSSLTSGVYFGSANYDREVDSGGISDERGFYYRKLGLLPALQAIKATGSSFPMQLERERKALRAQEARQDAPRPEPIIAGNVGMLVFRKSPGTQVIDPLALGDAFIARLPSTTEKHRIGHIKRHLPHGYAETVLTGVNHFQDPNLAKYFHKLMLIIRGPIWSKERWRAIWEMQTGQLNHLIDYEHYRHTGEPPKVK